MDTTYELPIAYRLTKASASDYNNLLPLIEKARIRHPELIKNAQECTAVERVNSRLDVSFGFELHTIRGRAKMKLRVGIALLVMLAMAVGSIKSGQKETMRSLVKKVA